MKRALVVGSAGQDGRLLTEKLQGEGAEVLGFSRQSIEAGTCPPLTDAAGIARAVADFRPDAVFYLAAYHHSSQEQLRARPGEVFARSFEVHVHGLLHFLEALRTASPATPLFYAASSLLFGEPASERQNEQTPYAPRCAYGISKAAGAHCCQHYRRTYGLRASVGILYNHESPYRAEKFVSQKIVHAAARIRRGEQETLVLGDLEARIDWGYAPDYVEAMCRIVALPEGDDFVIATGESHSVQEFVELAFARCELDWRQHVQIDPALLGRRKAPAVGDASRLNALTGWKPTVTFPELIDSLISPWLPWPARR